MKTKQNKQDRLCFKLRGEECYKIIALCANFSNQLKDTMSILAF